MTIRGKWAWAVVLLLVLSVGLNLFVLGAAAAWRHHGGGWHGGGKYAAMDRETRREARPYFRAAFRANKDELRAARRAVRAARGEVAELLQAEPLDRAELDAALMALRDSNVAALTTFQGVMLEAALAMPPELRQKIDWQRMRPPRGGRGPGGPDRASRWRDPPPE